ncbi:hypothetical protein ABD74_08260 [Brevibacillus laterosporus]|nr:hypothetical protein [Brevibacillus laterosporus]
MLKNLLTIQVYRINAASFVRNGADNRIIQSVKKKADLNKHAKKNRYPFDFATCRLDGYNFFTDEFHWLHAPLFLVFLDK